MNSLIIMLAALLFTLIATAWFTATLARTVGSQHGRFIVGLGMALLVFALNVVMIVISACLPAGSRATIFTLIVVLFLVQMTATIWIMKRAFDLSWLRSLVPFAGYITVLALQFAMAFYIIRPAFAESLRFPSGSMSPTLAPGARFLVNKTVQPKRFDLLVYWNHESPPQKFCKRLLAFPGEKLRFENGGIVVNDMPIMLPSVIAGRCHASLPKSPPSARVHYKDGETIQLGPDEYFLIGDNVEASADSRLYGPTPGGSIVGVADFIYWPLNKMTIVR